MVRSSNFTLTTTPVTQFVSLDDSKDRLLNSLWCPLRYVGTQCADPTLFSYYACCGELNKQCCSHLRLWLLLLIFSLPLFLLIPLLIVLLKKLCNFIRCKQQRDYKRGRTLIDVRIHRPPSEELELR